MTRPVRIGFVGAGFVGQVAHIANYTETPGCELTAIAEVRPGLREKVRERYGFRHAYAHHSEMLDAGVVDAVVVVVPRPLIGPIALDCMRAGKHVLTEKPMAGSVAQAQVLVSTARAAGVRYVVGTQRLHDEGIHHALALVERYTRSGEMGEPTVVRAHCFGGQAYCGIDGHVTTDEPHPGSGGGWDSAPDWIPEDRRDDFAFYLNTYCHNVNLLRRFAGGALPVAKSAEIGNRDGGVAVFDFDGRPGVLETGRFGYQGWDEVTEAYFERGRVRVVSPPSFLRNVAATVEVTRGGEAPEMIRPEMGHSWSFRRQAAAFVRTIAEHIPSVAAGADAILDFQMVEDLWGVHTGISAPAETPRLAAAG